MGNLSKPKGPDTASQGPSSQAGLSKESGLAPVLSSPLCAEGDVLYPTHKRSNVRHQSNS